MLTRLILLFLFGVCVTMNLLVWQAEYGAHDNDFPVPDTLVWRKIMTAPEASSLNVFQDGKRTGFCEFSTSVGQQMAQLDETKPPPEGFLSRAGYQIHINGNASLGDFTNRLKFDGHLEFAPNRAWRNLSFRILMRGLVIEMQSEATNQIVQVVLTRDGETFHHTLAFADLQDPNRLLRVFAGDWAGGLGGLLAGVDFPLIPSAPGGLASGIHWEATRSRVSFGREWVPVYRLETRVLDRPVVIIASTLGEILRVKLPWNVEASLDEWGQE
jgi:hypothetical protein